MSEIQSFLPNWLDNDFLEENLKEYFDDDDLHVIDFQAKPAVEKGKNTISSVLRLTVNFNKAPKNHEKTELSVIAKVARNDGHKFDLLSELGAYEKEIDFFDNIIPKMEFYLPLNEEDPILPAIYGICKQRGVILMEDLLSRNYSNKRTDELFNVDEAKWVLKKVAAFHAVAAVLQEEQANIFDCYRDGLINQKMDGFNDFLLRQLDAVYEVISMWPDFYEYATKIERLRGCLVEKVRELFRADPEHFNTLTHGDLWRNNLMMKYTSDGRKSRIENLVFLNFQFSCWNSPALDLHYFFGSSLHESLRWDHFDEFMECYHENLSSNLKTLNYLNHIPTPEEFKRQFFDKIFWGFVSTCLIQPLLINKTAGIADFEMLHFDNDESMSYIRKMFDCPKIHAILRRYVPYYDQVGVFD